MSYILEKQPCQPLRSNRATVSLFNKLLSPLSARHVHPLQPFSWKPVNPTVNKIIPSRPRGSATGGTGDNFMWFPVTLGLIGAVLYGNVKQTHLTGNEESGLRMRR